MLKLVPETTVEVIERCSGHNGTYAVKKEYRAASVKIGKPVVSKVAQAHADHYSSDCPMAGHQIHSGLAPDAAGLAAREPEHPMSLVRKAYGI
jgi:Fe-S oxidoreductase